MELIQFQKLGNNFIEQNHLVFCVQHKGTRRFRGLTFKGCLNLDDVINRTNFYMKLKGYKHGDKTVGS